MVKIDFEIEHPTYGVYRDALHLPEDHGLTDAEIEQMKQQRYDTWVNLIDNPPPAEVAPAPIADNPDDYIEINGVRYKKVVE